MRCSGVQSGKRHCYFESKQDGRLFHTHEIQKNRIIFLICKPLGELKKIVFEGDFDPQNLKTVKGVGDATDNLFDPFGGGFDNKALRYFIKNQIPYMKTIMISEKPTKFKGSGEINVNKEDLNKLIQDLNIQKKANSSEIKAIMHNFWSSKVPKLGLSSEALNSNKSLILRNLNDKLLKQLTGDEIDKFGEFYFEALEKHKSARIRKKRIRLLAEQAKILSLNELISRYEKLLREDPLENEWQKFFDDFVTLFDSRYQNNIDLKNISLGSTKYPDLILLDVYGFIDLYELKRCKTSLLRYDKSHKNYYWSDEMAATIAQASFYLHELKNNAPNFSQKIEEEKGMQVKVINPKAFIVAGTSNQLDCIKKQKQFKVLRESLKDVNFILYDELLVHLQNLLSKLKETTKVNS